MIHVQAHSEDTLFLELFSELDSERVGVMAELSEAIVGEAKLVVGEGGIYVELLLTTDSDLKLVLGPRVGNNLPVVYAVIERPIRDHCPEVVVRLIEEGMAAVS